MPEMPKVRDIDVFSTIEALKMEAPESVMLRDAVPIREIVEYGLGNRILDNAVKLRCRTGSMAAQIEGFVDYVIYSCPVRGCLTIAVLDRMGWWWTAPHWLYDKDRTEGEPFGHYVEFRAQQAVAEEDFPEITIRSDTGPLVMLVLRRFQLWGTNGIIPLMAQYDDVLLGPSLHMDRTEWQITRWAVMMAFDKEWGAEAYFKTQRAAQAAHGRVLARNRRRERERG